MSFEYQGKNIATDNEGYLSNFEDWSEDLMYFMAKNDGLELNDSHVVIIKLVQDYYKEFATTPAIRNLIKFLKTKGFENLASSITLAKLFPDGAAKSSSKYAGLPKPIKCI